MHQNSIVPGSIETWHENTTFAQRGYKTRDDKLLQMGKWVETMRQSYSA